MQYAAVQEIVKKYRNFLEISEQMAKAYNEKSFFGRTLLLKSNIKISERNLWMNCYLTF